MSNFNIDNEQLIERLTSNDPIFANEYFISPKYNAFKYVCDFGLFDLIKLGLENPLINVNCEANNESALSLALSKNSKEVCILLLNSDRIEFTSTSKIPYFIIACKNSDIDVIKILLNHPMIDPNEQSASNDNDTALMTLYHNTRDDTSTKEIISLLLDDPRIDFTLVNDYKENIFIVACTGIFEYVNLLIDHPNFRLNLNERNIYGQTAFFRACQRPNNNINKYRQFIISLIENPDIDTNLPNLNGVTPFMIACHNCNNDIIDILMECDKIDKTLTDNDGLTGFDHVFGAKLQLARKMYKYSEDMLLYTIKK